MTASLSDIKFCDQVPGSGGTLIDGEIMSMGSARWEPRHAFCAFPHISDIALMIAFSKEAQTKPVSF